jgi:hypothetical protein
MAYPFSFIRFLLSLTFDLDFRSANIFVSILERRCESWSHDASPAQRKVRLIKHVHSILQNQRASTLLIARMILDGRRIFPRRIRSHFALLVKIGSDQTDPI